MTDDSGLRFIGVFWAFIYGTLFYPLILALVWSSKGDWAKRVRWPITVLTVLYVIVMVILLLNAKRWT